MKKIIGFIFAFSISFFAFIISFSAWVGNSVYGINRIGVDNSNKFIIEGWAVIKGPGDVGAEVDNINPSFKITISLYKDSAKSQPLRDDNGSKIEFNYTTNIFYEKNPSLINDATVCYAYKADSQKDICNSASNQGWSNDKQYRNNYFLFEDASFVTNMQDIIGKYLESEDSRKKEVVFRNGFETWYKVTYKPLYFSIDLTVTLSNGTTRTINDINFLKQSVLSEINTKSGDVSFNFSSTDRVLSIVQGGHPRNSATFRGTAKAFDLNILTNYTYKVAAVQDGASSGFPISLKYFKMYRVFYQKDNHIPSAGNYMSNGQSTCGAPYTWNNTNKSGCWAVDSIGSNKWIRPWYSEEDGTPADDVWVPAFWVTLTGGNTTSRYGSECVNNCPSIIALLDSLENAVDKVKEFPDGSVMVSTNPDSKETYSYTCDVSENTETRTSNIPKLKKEIIFDNSYCKVECEEDVSVKYDGKKYVTAGMWFKYPINVDGKRFCEFDFYNYKKIFEDLKIIKEAYKCTACDNTYNVKTDIATWIIKEALENCIDLKDNFSTGPNKYTFDAKVSGKFEMSGGIQKEVGYKKTNDGILTNSFSNESYICVDKDTFNFSPCNKGEEGDNRVLVPITWNLNSNIKDAVYDIANVYYSEQSTGRIVTESEMSPTEKYYLAGEDGRVFFSDVRDATCKYPFKIFIDGIARNIGEYWERRKDVEITCEYEVKKGLITYSQEDAFCPGPTPPGGSCTEEQEKSTCCVGSNTTCCTKCKEGINVKYRQISLNKVFPTPSKLKNNYYGNNWLSEEGLKVAANIEKKGYTLYNQTPIYSFRAGVFQNVAIKLYNLTHKYGQFNLTEEEQSKFINSNLDKYKRGN